MFDTKNVAEADPLKVLQFEDEVLESAIRDTLEDIGEPAGDSITVGDMRKLTYLKIASQSQLGALNAEFADADTSVSSGVIITTRGINSLSGIEYAQNL